MTDKIIGLAKEAGAKILEYYSDEIEVTHKGDDSPLTKADLAAHHHIVAGLKTITPDIPIISEESGVPDYSERKEWTKFWMVDPLDGTKEFIKKNGEFTVNIALIENGKPVFGVVYVPAMDITYFGSVDEGTYKIDGDGTKTRLISPEFKKARKGPYRSKSFSRG